MVDTGSFAADRLRTIIERIERLEEDRAALNSDLKEVMSEAKGAGFDTKTIRQIVRLRKLEPTERIEQEQLLEIYRSAVGL
ncbi:MAG: DUF2312 domain-containing protein [Alphaproteobacteria bacterium]|jgi:uncharacterized protein (UPF0335 family)|nr:DUF2312 domain-containing protein [Alphaproteobacteria bacterium]|tara:strand:- start:1700 stop:1942 length:243 start_codon:yes stop_codon:yes gene_type:complete